MSRPARLLAPGAALIALTLAAVVAAQAPAVPEARIKLETLTLRTISKLVAGDVIPFQALKQDDIGVEVSANGSKL